MKKACEDTLNKIIPTLNMAINSIESIDKLDIANLRSMHKPPKSIKIALKIMCIFLGVPPADKISRKTKKPKKSYWRAAQGPQVLGNVHLPRLMVEFDRNKISQETMMLVEQEIKNPDFSYEKAYTASSSAQAIFKWIKYTRDYFYIFKEIEPRRDALLLSQKQFGSKFSVLEKNSSQLKNLDTALDTLKDHQREKDKIIAGLKSEIKDCLARKNRADLLIKRLNTEQHKWVVCIRMLQNKQNTLRGDAIMAAGYIDLLGGFG